VALESKVSVVKEFFETIKNSNPNEQCVTAAVISGSHIGEKAVCTGGKVRYLSDDNGFLASHRDQLEKVHGTGIMDIDGVSVYAERISRSKKMVICGAGHDAIAVTRLAKMIGMHVTVLDDRAEFVEKAEKAGADVGMAGSFDKTLPGIEGDEDTFFVIVTRGHQYDKQCLREILKKPHAYIGMMGSHRRVEMAKQNMVDEGFDRDLVYSIHSPIGLDINSETPEEIAISILAEVIQVKNAKKSSTFPDDIMTAILGGPHAGPDPRRKALATIIDRNGSAPREVGTKMLIFPDGTIVNTIGGGLFEYQTICRAVEMLKKENPKPEIVRVDLNATDAAKEGEVCGGALTVFLEEV
jgi:xanthine dehydrogenase accessory factor